MKFDSINYLQNLVGVFNILGYYALQPFYLDELKTILTKHIHLYKGVINIINNEIWISLYDKDVRVYIIKLRKGQYYGKN